MSTDKVDARVAWASKAEALVEAAVRTSWLSDGSSQTAHKNLYAHLRTQPEGYRMVPVEPTPAILACIELEWIANGSARKNYASLIAAAQEGK